MALLLSNPPLIAALSARRITQQKSVVQIKEKTVSISKYKFSRPPPVKAKHCYSEEEQSALARPLLLLSKGRLGHLALLARERAGLRTRLFSTKSSREREQSRLEIKEDLHWP